MTIHPALKTTKGAFGATILGIFLISAFLAPWITPHRDMDFTLRLLPPSWGSGPHPLGCDVYGGDLLTGLILGARTSFYVAFATMILSMGTGIFLGLIAGYWGGIWETLIMRTVDVLMAFPGILLAMGLSSLLGPSIENVIFAISVTGWTSTARIVRGQVLSLKTREYVLAAISVGAFWPRIFWFYFLPNLFPLLLITATSSFAGIILTESSLSFLGLGAKSADAATSWGGLLSQGKTVLFQAPHVSFFPGLAISLVILSCNFLGDSLRETLFHKTEKQA